LFSYKELPPLPPEGADQSFGWLQRQPVQEASMAESIFSDGAKPDLGKLPQIIGAADPRPSASFVRFIGAIDLHRRMRSVTDCYFDLGDRIIRTQDPHAGYLVHFLSDSQWCGHWYLHVSPTSQAVLASLNAYGFNMDEDDDPDAPWRKNEIELESEEIYLCAASFPEFIYRFWLENELWFALSENHQRLPSEQANYAEHYRRNSS
jgi:hypothetical protein